MARSSRLRLRVLAYRVAALAVGGLVSLGIVEMAVRALIGEQAKFPRRVVEAPWGLRYNEPGAAYRHKSADVSIRFRINARGMRAEREYPYEKPPGTVRIVSLGDSFTIGYEVDFEDTFSAVLEHGLREAGYRVEVLNAGVSGFSTAEAYLYLERELWKYDPDVVMLSFFPNDPIDNIRTGLFRLEDGELVQVAERYVPGGWLGNLLNTNPVLSTLSERSDAFTYLKERLTMLVKRGLVQRNIREFSSGDEGGDSAEAGDVRDYEQALATALLERLYASTRQRGVPLVIHSIPQEAIPGTTRMFDRFPAGFDTDRPGIVFFPAIEVLQPLAGEELLYWKRSHGHWTPISHRRAGEGLARAILASGVLDGVAQPRSEPARLEPAG